MTTLYLDASSLAAWSNCREFWRRQFIEKIEPIKPSIYYEYGKAIHTMCESFWRGETYDQAMALTYDCLNLYPVGMLNPSELDTWERMVKGTPLVTAAYFDAVSYDPEQLLWVEKEWSIPYDLRTISSGISNDSQDSNVNTDAGFGVDTGIHHQTQVILCGRMDRLMVGPRLVDVKTASEISNGGVPWKAAYRQDKVLDMQFALYDWYLCHMCRCGHPLKEHHYHDHHCQNISLCNCIKYQSMAPIEIYLEVLLKPYKSKPARYERIELNELITDMYRKRFKQQLAWKISEIVHYVENYSQQKPWPLAGGLACSSRYGTCNYQPLCAWGDSEKLLAKYQPREPHLELVRLAEAK